MKAEMNMDGVSAGGWTGTKRIGFFGRMPGRLAIIVLLAFTVGAVSAADMMKITIRNRVISAYRTSDLEAAKTEAVKAHKPIAWISTSSKVLDGSKGDINWQNGRGATLHAFFSLNPYCVLIFMDAFKENHRVPSLMDDALHTPDPHYTPPTVLFLDPHATNVLAKVTYEPDYSKRAAALGKALTDIKGKF